MCGLCIYVRIFTDMYIFQCKYVCLYICMCNMTCVRCISSSDCDGFSMSLMERAVKVSDWSLQSILSIVSMAMLLTIGFIYIHIHTYINTYMRSKNHRAIR